MTESQNKQILDYLKSGKSLTPLEALSLFDCWALSSRIANLKQEGYDIVTEMINDEKTGKRYAKYHLISDQLKLKLTA